MVTFIPNESWYCIPCAQHNESYFCALCGRRMEDASDRERWASFTVDAVIVAGLDEHPESRVECEADLSAGRPRHTVCLREHDDAAHA